MRLGGPPFGDCADPDRWIAELGRHGYRAAYCPIDNTADDSAVRAYEDAARRNDIVIAEVGAWSNPLAPDAAQRTAALAHCQAQLALADRIGARCCVNISGSRGEQWDGPHPLNLTRETFDQIVDCARAIIDAVQPRRSCYALETMPWMYPDSADSYVALIKAIDRERFAVHLDPVNLVCSPQRYSANASLIRECFEKLGPRIRSCHAKDITLAGRLTVHLDEARPGLGGLDYAAYLRELNKLDPDTPLMLEHLPDEQEYTLAANHIRTVARETLGVVL
ncbi:MAG: sugar phosphate isomerase/epimerase [Candidatus Hydrogenedentes bacterium]|nr:sugar phosphate isomerase/epimerase [Candidatus Hydrogenedentota bacterium]